MFTAPIHAAARLLPMGRWATERLECGQTFDGAFMEKPALQSGPVSSSINTRTSLLMVKRDVRTENLGTAEFSLTESCKIGLQDDLSAEICTVTSNDSGLLSLLLRSLKIWFTYTLCACVIKSGLGSILHGILLQCRGPDVTAFTQIISAPRSSSSLQRLLLLLRVISEI